MQDDGIKADAVKEAEVDGQFLDIVEYRTSDFDDGKLGGMGGV